MKRSIRMAGALLGLASTLASASVPIDSFPSTEAALTPSLAIDRRAVDASTIKGPTRALTEMAGRRKNASHSKNSPDPADNAPVQAPGTTP